MGADATPRILCVALLGILLLACTTKALHANGLQHHEHPRGSNTVRVKRLYDQSELPPPYFSALLHQGFLSKAAKRLRPVLQDIALTTTIEGNETDHYSYANISLTRFDLGDLHVSLGSPSTVIIRFSNISLSIPWTDFSVFEKIWGHKFGCDGQFSAESTGSDMILFVTLGKNATSSAIEIANVDSSVNFGSINIDHRFNSIVCKVAGKFLSLLLGDLNKVAARLVREMLPEKMAKIITEKGNAIFNVIPVTLVTPPVVSNNTSLECTLVLFATPGWEPVIVPPSFEAFPVRDVELYVPSVSFNDVFALIDVLGLFNFTHAIPASDVNTTTTKALLPTVYEKCPDCPFGIDIALPVAPVVNFSAFSGAGLQVVELLAAVSSLDESRNTSNFVLSVALNATVQVQNLTVVGSNGSTFMFKISVPTFTFNVQKSAIGPVDLSIVSSVIQFFIQNIVVPTFNNNFKGIQMPSLGGVTVANVVFDVADAQFGFAGDVNL